MSLGISAEGTDYAQRPGDEDDQLVFTCLAYGRVAGKFRLHVRETTRAKDEWGNWNEVIATEDTPWSSCTREEKLQSFATLPELLGVIAERAFRLTEETAATSQTVRDVIRAIDSENVHAGLDVLITVVDKTDGETNRDTVIGRRSEVMPRPRRTRQE